jgi:hypothetical protein
MVCDLLIRVKRMVCHGSCTFSAMRFWWTKYFIKTLLITGLSSRSSRFDPRLFLLGFVLYKVVVKQVVTEHFGFPLSVSCYQCSILLFYSAVPHVVRSPETLYNSLNNSSSEWSYNILIRPRPVSFSLLHEMCQKRLMQDTTLHKIRTVNTIVRYPSIQS